MHSSHAAYNFNFGGYFLEGASAYYCDRRTDKKRALPLQLRQGPDLPAMRQAQSPWW